MYVAGNYYRGSYKKPHWGLHEASPVGAWGKLEAASPYLGAAAGVGKKQFTRTGMLSDLSLLGWQRWLL